MVLSGSPGPQHTSRESEVLTDCRKQIYVPAKIFGRDDVQPRLGEKINLVERRHGRYRRLHSHTPSEIVEIPSPPLHPGREMAVLPGGTWEMY